MRLRYDVVSICFAEFRNPTWNCRGICPGDGRARCITGGTPWNEEVSHFSRCCTTKPRFRPHRMKSPDRNSYRNTFHIFPPTHLCPLQFLRERKLYLCYTQMSILNLLSVPFFVEHLFQFQPFKELYRVTHLSSHLDSIQFFSQLYDFISNKIK